MNAFTEGRGNFDIAKTIEQLAEDNENGQISCLVAIVIRPSGESARIIHGTADNIALLGSIEMLKSFVIKSEVESEWHEEPRQLLS